MEHSEKEHLVKKGGGGGAKSIWESFSGDNTSPSEFELSNSSTTPPSATSTGDRKNHHTGDRTRNHTDDRPRYCQTPTEDQPRTLRERIVQSEWFPVSFVLVFAFFITVVEHGVRFNIELYTEQVLNYPIGTTPTLIDVYDAVAPCLPLIGGWLADAWFPRLKVTVTGSIITLVGIIMLTINVAPYSDEVEENFPVETKRAIFVLGFTGIFVGLALYDANDYVMAARELENTHGNKNKEKIRTLFVVFYLVFFAAVFFARLIFQLASLFAVYMVVAFLVILATVAILLGRNLYAQENREKHTLWNQFRIIWEGVSRRKDAPTVAKWLDRASIEHGGSFTPSQVYDTSHLLRTIPIFHTVTIFIIVNYFIENTYPEQTARLKPATVRDDVTIAEVMYQLYQPIVSFLTNLLMLAILQPCFDRCGRCVSPFVRIGVGILFGTLSIIFAAIIETQRKQSIITSGYETSTLIGGTDGYTEDTFTLLTGWADNVTAETTTLIGLVENVTTNKSSLSVTSQIPQYTCAGIGEALVLTAGVEISYVEAPPHLKGFTVGLFILMSGVGSYILAQLIVLLVNAISGASGQKWYTDDIDAGRLEYFYYLLAAILLLDMLYLYLLSRKYEPADWSNPHSHSSDRLLDQGEQDNVAEEDAGLPYVARKRTRYGSETPGD